MRRGASAWRSSLVVAVTFGCLGGLFGAVPHSMASGISGHDPLRAGSSSSPRPPPLVGPAAASALLHQRVRSVVLGGSRGDLYLGLPGWFAYDPADRSFYVAAGLANTDVIPYNSGSPFVSQSLTVGSDPFAVAVDTAPGDVFVTNNGSNNVSVISGSTEKVVASIAVGSGPAGIAFDPDSGSLFVANRGSNNVSVISGTSLSVVGTVPVGGDPIGVVYDGASGQVFVADHGSAQVSVLSGTDLAVVATIGVGLGPYGVAVDNASDTIYVTDQGSNNLSVLSAVGDDVVATVPVYYPWGIAANLEGLAYDPADGYVWVGAGSFFTVLVNPSNETVIGFLDVDPSGVVYDPDSGAVCVTNTANVSFACFMFPGPDGSPATYLSFEESGLPSGTPWTVSLGTYGLRESSTSNSITFGVGPDQDLGPSIAYSVGPSDRYAANPGTGVVNTSTLPTTIPITFVWSPGPFSVTFDEVGLPVGTAWSVTLAGTFQSSTGASIDFSEPSGTYDYTIGTVPGWREPGVPYSGTVEVNGGAVVVPTLIFSPYTYTANFTETGLPQWTLWTLTLDGTAGDSGTPQIFFSEPNGSYDYTVGGVPGFVTPAGGTLVVDGANVSVTVGFSPVFVITFGEAGLPPGSLWNVTLGGATLNSTGTEIPFSEPNGTYPFLVASAGFSASPASGTLVVVGTPLSQGVTFVPVPTGQFSVVFSESGLTAGIGWSVTVANRSLAIDETLGAVAPDPITFYLPNGTYSWGVYVPAGYSADLPSGPLIVNGAGSKAAPVSFEPTVSGASPSPPPSRTVADDRCRRGGGRDRGRRGRDAPSAEPTPCSLTRSPRGLRPRTCPIERRPPEHHGYL